MAHVVINGLGRIGRATLKILLDTPDVEVVGVNDLLDPGDLAYLFKHDTVYGRYGGTVEAGDGELIVDGRRIRVSSEKDPASIPWPGDGPDVVFECTGVFRRRRDLEKHLDAGAKRVILSAPSKGDDVTTIVHGVNTEDAEGESIISCASCTTNCITPVMEIMKRRIGVEKAQMTTLHAYTASQKLVDGPSKKRRRGRAASQNLVPTTTGAAEATTRALPELSGRFDGVAVRAPVPVGSISDIVLVASRATDADEINSIFRDESGSERYKGIVGVSDDEIVSADIIRDDRASVVDLTMTGVVGRDLVKVLAWYDNEWGYAAQMVRQARVMLGLERTLAAAGA